MSQFLVLVAFMATAMLIAKDCAVWWWGRRRDWRRACREEEDRIRWAHAWRWRRLWWWLAGRRRCPACLGIGRVFNSYDWRTCEVCGGRGWLERK